MKTKTENILMVLKVLALMGGIGYSIECGSQLLTVVSSFINPEWSSHTLAGKQELFGLREYSVRYYAYAMSFVMSIAALKALTWYFLFDLLLKLTLKTPFTIEVAKKLEKIAYLLFDVWVVSIVGRMYVKWLLKTTGASLGSISQQDEYLFVSGIVYIISQVFKRGIELQSENELTV